MANKKTGKHLQFYMDCINNGRMPYRVGINNGGLCLMAEANEIDRELFTIFSEDQGCYCYWADETTDSIIKANERRFVFSKLRQTIVLLMACLNNEL
jgi:hypothetical protein